MPTTKNPDEFEEPALALGAVPGAPSLSDLLLLSDTFELDPGIVVLVLALDPAPAPAPDPVPAPDTFPRDVLT